MVIRRLGADTLFLNKWLGSRILLSLPLLFAVNVWTKKGILKRRKLNYTKLQANWRFRMVMHLLQWHSTILEGPVCLSSAAVSVFPAKRSVPQVNECGSPETRVSLSGVLLLLPRAGLASLTILQLWKFLSFVSKHSGELAQLAPGSHRSKDPSIIAPELI